MSDFFAPLPAPPPPEEPRRRVRPPWQARPRGIVTAGVPLELVLGRTGELAVVLSRLGACAEGFEAELSMLAAVEDDDLDLAPFGPRARRARAGDDAGMRLGVRYADGSQGELDAPWERDHRERPSGPVIVQGGGSGGGGEWRQSLWFWPLPPEGPLTFALEWLEHGIELQLHECDSAPIREAAERALVLFDATQMPGTPGSTSSAVHLRPRDVEGES